jgi:hypothetical protein
MPRRLIFWLACIRGRNLSDIKTIRIDLDLVGNPSIEPNDPSFIQREAGEKVLRALARPVEVPSDDLEDGDRPPALNVLRERRHDAILVSARRGEGKTTFIASILATVQTDAYRKLINDTREGIPVPRLYSLGIIDPTLIETKQNIVIVIIDRIRIATEHRRRRSGRFDDYSIVESALRKLAQGLSLLDGIGELIDLLYVVLMLLQMNFMLHLRCSHQPSDILGDTGYNAQHSTSEKTLST